MGCTTLESIIIRRIWLVPPRLGLVSRCGLEQIQVGGKCIERVERRESEARVERGRREDHGVKWKDEGEGEGAARPVRASCLAVKWSFLGWQNGCRSRSSELIWWIWSTRREVRDGYEDDTPSANACGLL